MKITGQSIPAALAEKYKNLVSTDATGASAGTKAKTRRGARISPTKKKATTKYNDLALAVEILFVRLGYSRKENEFKLLVRAEKKAINSGVWNPDFWTQATLQNTDYLSNAPTYTPDANPPPYGYRNATNQPTKPTYTDGTASTAPARYAGATTANYFHDNLLAWQRTTYLLKTPIKPDLAEPALITFDGTLTASSNSRGSRPMLSIVMRSYLTNSPSPTLTTTENPISKLPVSAPPTAKGTNSLYWRYRVPVTVAPFFSTVKLRKILRNLPNIASITGTTDLTHAVINTAPRPMFGRGYNNNTSINTSLTGTPKIYQISKCIGTKNIIKLETAKLLNAYVYDSGLVSGQIAAAAFIYITLQPKQTLAQYMHKWLMAQPPLDNTASWVVFIGQPWTELLPAWPLLTMQKVSNISPIPTQNDGTIIRMNLYRIRQMEPC